MTDRTTAVSRILATSGHIAQTDKDTVLNEASRVLSKLRGTSPKGDLGTLAAALVCMSEDVALRIEAEESADGREAIRRLKAAFCVRFQEAEVNRLQKELGALS